MNQKISEMDYKPLSADDQFPIINGSDTTNYQTYGQDIINLVKVYHWTSDKVYQIGELVVYNSSTTKGLFLVTAETSLGDSPENSGYAKFKSIALSFIPNDIPVVGLSPSISLGYLRTCRISFPIASPAISSGTYLVVLSTSFLESEIRNAKIDCTVSHNGQFSNVQVRSATSSGGSGAIAIYLEFFSNTANAFNVDVKIEL